MMSFLIPASFGEAEMTEKRSRFTGRVWPSETEEEALAHIREMREKYWDATHNVYAYMIREGGAMRYSDDGEPQGTSGQPVLNVFRSAGIENFCCVVTRYFGGVLLGAGGLVRAYSAAASMALAAAGTAEMRLWRRVSLRCPYPLLERAKNEMTALCAVTEGTVYGADVEIAAALPEESFEALALRLREISSGSLTLNSTETVYRAIPL